MRKEVASHVLVQRNGQESVMEDAMIYVTNAEEAKQVETSSLIMGSVMMVVDEGSVYMLDGDGNQGGTWRSVRDGTEMR